MQEAAEEEAVVVIKVVLDIPAQILNLSTEVVILIIINLNRILEWEWVLALS